MTDAKKFYDMSMDELETEIRETKTKLTALEKLIEVRRLMGEKTTKQLNASMSAKSKKKKTTVEATKSTAKTEKSATKTY